MTYLANNAKTPSMDSEAKAEISFGPIHKEFRLCLACFILGLYSLK